MWRKQKLGSVSLAPLQHGQTYTMLLHTCTFYTTKQGMVSVIKLPIVECPITMPGS